MTGSLASRLAALAELARGDFRERTRSYAFFVTLVLAVFVANAFLPANHSTYVTMQMDGHRGVYSSAWVGSLVAILTSVFLGLVGFYLVRGTIERDRRSGVGAVLAATRLGRIEYLLGKTASNFAVLFALTSVVAVAAGALQLVRAEDTNLAPLDLLLPFVVLTLPVLLVLAAVAVLFECVPGLSGGFGNVLFYFVWCATLAVSVFRNGHGEVQADLFGVAPVVREAFAACAREFPGFDPAAAKLSLGFNFRRSGLWSLTTFPFAGVPWDHDALFGRPAVAIAASLGIVLLAAIFFDRFVSEPRLRRAQPDATANGLTDEGERRSEATPRPVRVARLPAGVRQAGIGRRLARLLRAELVLLARGQSRWWYAIALGLAIALAFAPLEVARQRLLPVIWLWPVLVWSPLGNRERTSGVEPVLHAVPHAVGVPMIASWLAGATLALTLASPLIVRLVAAGDLAGVLGLVAGAAFIPALALGLGAATGTARAFEAVYTMLWYIGPLQLLPRLDFMAATSEAVAIGTPAVVSLATVLLLTAAVAARARRLAG